VRLVVGVDIGTQGTKTVVHREDGICVAEAFARSRPHRPTPGVVEEDPADQIAAVAHTIKECLEQVGPDRTRIVGIALAGQMAGIIGVDSRGNALTPYDSWLDARCAPHIETMRAHGDAVLRKTGNAPSFNHGPKILWWKSERPETYRRIRAFVQPGAYAAMRLAGLDASQAFIDPTYLHFTGFADNVALRWDPDLCTRFDVEASRLPRIVACTSAVGAVTNEMARLTGLPSGTPVFAGCGDTAASFLACGATDPGICVDVAGTASVFAATTGSFKPDTHTGILGCGRSALPDLWHPYAYIGGGGQNLEWFRTSILSGSRTFDELNAEAAALADRDETLPFFIPHLGGRVSPPCPTLHGSWANLTWNATSGALYRAILEGVALEYTLYRDAVRSCFPAFDVREIRITGGGEKSRVWNQLKADRLQARVVGIVRGGGAPLGAAMVAAVGAGVISDARTAASRWLALGPCVEPNPKSAALSRRRTEAYRQLLEALRAWSAPPVCNP